MTTLLSLDGIDLWDPARGWRQQRGVRGLGLPPVTIETERRPGVAGAALLGQVIDARPITIPLHIRASTAEAARTALASVEAACMRRGSVELAAVRDGQRLTTDVVYVEGLEGDDSLEIRGEEWVVILLRLLALDPWWYGAHEEAIVATASSSRPIYPPLVPLAPSSSSTLGQISITNGGTAPTYPRIVVNGPTSRVILTSGSGQRFEYAAAVSSTQQLVIDMDPLAQVVEILDTGASSGASGWTSVTPDSSLWALTPGSQTIGVQLDGATSSTQARVQWRPRYVSVT